MPKVTAFGDVGAGNGGVVSINKTVLAARGTLVCFLDPSRLMFQRQIPGMLDPERWQLAIYNLATREFEAVPFGERGANFLAAGGRRWMAYVAGLGVYDQTGTVWPHAGLAATGTDGRGAVGRDGTIGFVRDYQGGHGLQLLAPNGESIDLPDVAIQTLCIFDRTLAVWIDRGQVRAWGRPDPAPQAEPVSSVRIVRAAGAFFLLVTTNTRLILRRWEWAVGKVLATTPTTFAADAAALNDTTVRVVWSHGIEEHPDEIDSVDVAIAELGEAITAPMTTTVKDPLPKKCEVTVDAFALTPAANLPDGEIAVFHDRENPNGAHVRVWVEGGSCRMSIDYPGAGAGLKGETGARRPVR